MRTILISICFALLPLCAYPQSKLVGGAGKASKVGEPAATKTVKTPAPVKRTPSQSSTVNKDPNAKFASSGYMEISGVSFANVDFDGHIIDDYGANLYANEVKYLKPKVFYQGLASVEKEISVDIKIIREDGTLETGAASPNGYTYSYQYKVEPGSGKYIELSGWGRNSGGSYSSGQYKFEVWYNGSILYQKGIRLYSGSTPLATSKILKINSVTFANHTKDGTTINDYGSTLYEGDVQYVAPKLYYNGLYSNNQNITLYYKIFYPTGSMMSGSSSPLCYTSKQEVVIKPGSNYLELYGYGSQSTTVYKEGAHKIEYWLDGEKIYETQFEVKKKTSNSAGNSGEYSSTSSTITFLGDLIKYPMGDIYYSDRSTSPQKLLSELNKKWAVDDMSSGSNSSYYVFSSSNDLSKYKYYGMDLYYFYYYKSGDNGSIDGRIKYVWQINTSCDIFDIMNNIIRDCIANDIYLSYTKDDKDGALGSYRINNIEYEIKLEKSGEHYEIAINKWYFKE